MENSRRIAMMIWNDFIARPHNKKQDYNFSFEQLDKAIQEEIKRQTK